MNKNYILDLISFGFRAYFFYLVYQLWNTDAVTAQALLALNLATTIGSFSDQDRVATTLRFVKDRLP